MKIKIQIKSISGTVLFEYEKTANTILDTLKEAVKLKKNLRGANLTGANLTGEKIKNAAVFTGLYQYVVIPYITESDVKRIKMGCYDRTLTDWESDFWNNNNEFPNDKSEKSQLRLMAYNTAKFWFDIVNVKKEA